MRVFAPAKVNLALHVTGRRADAYHLLDSLVVFAGVGDRLTITPSDRRRLTVTGPFAKGVPTGPDNLIWRAADLLDPEGTADIALEKTLPHGAGIGGGSSDAAAALRALAELWERPLPQPDDLLAVGADLPVCLHGRPVRMRGIGEVLEEVPPLPPLWLVLSRPALQVPTGAVFKALRHTESPPMASPDWTSSGFIAWLEAQRNDLEAAAETVVDGLSQTRIKLAETAPLLTRMSGSGGTFFGLFGSQADAEAAATELRAGSPTDQWIKVAPILG